MQHRASCQCGALELEMNGDPDFVVACCCQACQKRTGAPYGVGAYFPKTVVSIHGVRKAWGRETESGRKLTNHFCPKCGTNLFWTLELRPDHLGVALGCLATEVAEPMRVIWLKEKHDWVTFPEHWPTFDETSPPS